MASGTLGAEEVREKKPRWNENSKVYTRKFHKKNKNIESSTNNQIIVSTTINAIHNHENGSSQKADFSQNVNEIDNETAQKDESTQIVNGNGFGIAQEDESAPIVDGNDESNQIVDRNGFGIAQEDESAQIVDGEDESNQIVDGNGFGIAQEDESAQIVDGKHESNQIVNGNGLEIVKEYESTQIVNGNGFGSAHEDESTQIVDGNGSGIAQEDESKQIVNGKGLEIVQEDESKQIVNGKGIEIAQEDESMQIGNGNEFGTTQEDESTRIVNENGFGIAQKGESNQIVNGNDVTTSNDSNNVTEPPELQNSHQEQPISPRIEVDSGDTSSLNRQEGDFMNDNDKNVGKESTLDKPVVMQIDNDDDAAKLQSPVAEDANSHQERSISPPIELGSGDTSSPNRQEIVLLDDNDGNVGNESTLAVITPIDNGRVRISYSAARLKHEMRDLKRKLISELEETKSVAKKLRDKEAQVSQYIGDLATGNVVLPVGGAGKVHSLYSTGGGLGQDGNLRMISDSRPFPNLSVSVMDNTRRVVDILEKEKRTPKANQFYRSSDFIIGTDKLPPVESNKKSKSHGSKKKGGGGSATTEKQIFKKCSSLLTKLMKHQYGWVFNTPVDVKRMGLHDYYEIIKHPMDLGTVKSRLSKNWYKSPLEFAEDVRLTFRNAMIYNPEGQDVHIMAVDLSNVFEEKWVEIEGEYSNKLRYEAIYDMGLPRRAPSPPPRPFIPARHVPAPSVSQDLKPKPVYNPPVGRTPALAKPKAKDLNKRDMTSEEKQKLSTNLQALPAERLNSVVQIIKKRNSTLSEHDDEIEVDIDSVDAETLWELDRFVTNYKKSLSKHRRKAELARQRAEAQQAMQVMNPVPPKAEATKERRAGSFDDANAGAQSSLVPERKEADNASDSSSSSSSSSSSGSSSSDSDSDSSSESESNGR